MDGVSAIGLAASILTFIDFSWNLLSGTRDVYQSASGTTTENAHIYTVITDLQNASLGLHLDRTERSVSRHLQQLGFVADDCVLISQKLMDLLNDVRRKEGNVLWQSFKTKWKSMRSDSEVKKLLADLTLYRSQIILRLNLILK